ncbi:MAG: chorismate mutase [Alphaproteobacteria bacterium]
MTARDCNTLGEIRSNIDRIDRELVKLLAERASFVRRAGELKATREAIVDPKRIEDIIADVRRRSRDLGLEADVAEDVFRVMIGRFIDFEYEVFDRAHG